MFVTLPEKRTSLKLLIFFKQIPVRNLETTANPKEVGIGTMHSASAAFHESKMKTIPKMQKERELCSAGQMQRHRVRKYY